ncbi:MAG: ABC transporter ATP-binding protein [Solirubrobacteraceae bacterium]|nr:ABC transporter ATP-binding protein [Solirubrobacteraceae bacterium]
MNPSGICARGVDMVFSHGGTDQVVLDGVDLDIPAGGFVTLLGPSGCGKSTLLKILGGLLRPTAGSVRVGELSAEDAVKSREIGLVFQRPALLPWKTATGNVALLNELVGGRRAKASARATAEKMLDLVGLADAGSKIPEKLSGGMAQRVSIARALALDPTILLMDEPFGALDAITRDRMNASLLDIWSRTGKTVVFVTHSIAEAVFLSDEIHVMDAGPGRIVESLSVELPRPRTADTLDDPRFVEYEHHLRKRLGSGATEQTS